jgi:hypothetical protein
MAFFDFSQPLAGPLGQTVDSTPAKAVEAAFERLEWQIIALARKDGLHSLREPGRWRRFGDLVFGKQPSATLASERLEALRRLAVEAWHRGYAVSLSALDAFRQAGFTMAQLELLLATISAGRSAPGRKTLA